MKVCALLAGLLIALGTAGCDQEPMEVSVVQQYSDIQSEWQDMALVYGFAFDNAELADVARNAFANAYPERQYRVVTRQMPTWKYERLKKQIEAP
jgi:hypothetical protein